MEPVSIGGLIELGTMAINKIWPDPVKQAEEQRKLAELAQKGNLEELQAHVTLMLGQLDINKIDAKSSGWFQANWRPSIGWVGSVSLALMYIPKALVMTYIWTYQSITLLGEWDGTGNLNIPAFPDLGVSDVIGLLMSMLGVAAMRSYDKKNGIDTKQD